MGTVAGAAAKPWLNIFPVGLVGTTLIGVTVMLAVDLGARSIG